MAEVAGVEAELFGKVKARRGSGTAHALRSLAAPNAVCLSVKVCLNVNSCNLLLKRWCLLSRHKEI